MSVRLEGDVITSNDSILSGNIGIDSASIIGDNTSICSCHCACFRASKHKRYAQQATPPTLSLSALNVYISFCFVYVLFSRRKHRYKVRRSPSHIKHLLPSVLPMKEFHNYHRTDQFDQYRTSSTMDDSHMLLQHHNDAAYLFDIDFNSVIESRTQTTLLQHNLGPPDLPPLYQPQHRASI